MQTSPRRALMFALKFSDQFILGCAFFLAIAAVSDTIDTFRFYQFLFLRVRAVNFFLYLVFAWCWYGIFWSMGLYHSRRFHTWRVELKEVVNATLLGTFLLLIFGMLFSISLATPTFLFLFWTFTTVATLTSRLLLRSLLEHFRRRRISVQQLLIIGTNSRAVRFAQKIDNRLELGCRVIGFVDDLWAGTAKFLKSGYPLVADFAGFNEFLKKNVVDEVIIDLPLNSFYRQTQDIVRHC
jgi:FlaA1/EpsC-like NDP-sugar epimerase